MEFKGAIFDIDGTLLDSMGVWYQIDIDFFKRYDMDMPEGYSEKVAQMGSWQTAEYTSEIMNGRFRPDELMKIWLDMAKDYYKNTLKLKPHAKEYLEILKAKGYKLGVATALCDDVFRPALERCGVYDLFDVFVSSGEMKLEKSSPEVYVHTAEKMGVKPSECMVFEDIVPGIIGAKKGGFYAVGVYDSHGRQNQEQLKDAADKYIFDFKEMYS